MTSNATDPTQAATTYSQATTVALRVGIPLIIVIFAAIVVLLVVLRWLIVRSGVKYNAGRYQNVPTEDPHFKNLPYPPCVKIGDPPLPSMTFHMATQLSDPTMNGSRYPFMQHKATSQMSMHEKRPPRLRTRRKGNHKHGKGMHSILNDAEPTPEVVRERQKEKSERSSSVISLGTAAEKIFIVPAGKKTLQASSPDGSLPGIYLTLLYNKDTASLVVRLERVVGLPFREDGSEVDAYVRVFFIPKLAALPYRKTSKSRTARRDSAPVFDEDIRYEAMSAEELINSTLHVQVLDYKSYGKHHVLGQADLELVQVQFEKGEASVTLPLYLPMACENLGTVLLSLCYSHESKKLSIIILRAKDLNKGVAKDIDAQAKVYVSLRDKIVGKLKTKKKPQSCSPIFNEAMTCTIEPENIRNITVKLVLTNESSHVSKKEVGQVVLGSHVLGEEYRHWNDVMATPGKHIAEWHELRC